jgi:hypothetical protein
MRYATTPHCTPQHTAERLQYFTSAEGQYKGEIVLEEDMTVDLQAGGGSEGGFLFKISSSSRSLHLSGTSQ